MSDKSIEERGLLQPEEFEVDDLDFYGASNGDHDFTTTSGRRRSSRRWLRPRYICIALIAVLVLLLLGTFSSKQTGFKIPKYRPGAYPASSSLPLKLTEDPVVQAAPISLAVHEDDAKGVISYHNGYRPATKAQHDSQPTTPTHAEEIPLTTIIAPTGESDDRFATSVNFNSTDSVTPGYAEKEYNASLPWTKPEEFKIIGLVFYGRRASAAILNCYLERNMVANGGWLDEVHFAVNTAEEEDLNYLEKLLESRRDYRRLPVFKTGPEGYNEIWGKVKKETLYIKIDDDIVYFDDDAIPNLVYTKLYHPHSFAVVANLINSPETDSLHYHTGAIHSYLPELVPSNTSLGDVEADQSTEWRASALPLWSGAGEEMVFSRAKAHLSSNPSDTRHRWLPLPKDKENLWRTPFGMYNRSSAVPEGLSWSTGAQAHYSFLHNLEDGRLDRYHSGTGLDSTHEGIWNMQYEHMHINFMAIWGRDVRDHLPFDNVGDERALSVDIPLKLKRPLLINTHAMAAHFSSRKQPEMYNIDLLDRYRAYANEQICHESNRVLIE